MYLNLAKPFAFATKGADEMTKTIIGATMIVAGGLLFGVLLSGGLLFPHIIGPATLVAVGVILVAFKRKGARNE